MKGINTYLNFDGNCRDAMTFYAKCLGSKLELMSFGDTPGDHPKEIKDRVMHAKIGEGASLIMASDHDPQGKFQPGNNFSVAIHCESVDEIERLYKAFSEKGTQTMALQDTFWGARFGMLVDQFGIHWMFNYEKPKQ